MTPRALPIVNAIGCLVLTGLVVVQWRRERAGIDELAQAKAALTLSLRQTDEEVKRRLLLERDIAGLKEALEATRKAAETNSRTESEKGLAELAAAREQITTWEAAMKTRDEQIRTLDANLAETRKRLDEAIAKLKAAGAR